MKSWIVFVAALVGTQAYASGFTCNIPPGTPSIESTVVRLQLSDDGKEIEQKTILWPAHTRLMVTSDKTDVNGDRVVEGQVLSTLGVACPGSCPLTTFTLTIGFATNGITPNGKYESTTRGFNESSGPFQVHSSSDYICN